MSAKTTRTEFDAAMEAGGLALGKQQIGDHPFYINPITGEAVSLEKFLADPLRKITTKKFESIPSFEAYVNRFKNAQSSIYLRDRDVVCDIDHRSPEGKLEWGDHVAMFSLEWSEHYSKWSGKSNLELPQESFADLLEELADDIVFPCSADMLEIARELHITTNSACSSYIRAGANHSMCFTSEKKATSRDGVEIPTRFKIGLQPFRNSPGIVPVVARLKIKIKGEHPCFIYELQEIKSAVDLAKAHVLDEVEKSTALPVYR